MIERRLPGQTTILPASQYRRRILLYRIGQLGDAVIALPALWAIRAAHRDAYIALLTNSHGSDGSASAPAVLPREGLFQDVISYPPGDQRSLRSAVLLLRDLRRRRFDTLVYLAPRRRTRAQIWRDLLFFRLTGIREFIGHRGFVPLPERVPISGPPLLQHEADHLLSRLAASGIGVPPSGQGCMDLGLASKEIEAAQKWLRFHASAAQGRPLVGVGPGSAMPSKTWPEENYSRLGASLVADFDVFPVVFGSAQDRALGDRLTARWARGANAAGSLDVREAAAALSLCRFYVGNDTGTMHLAAAVGTPCVAVFSARDWPGRWYPYGPGHVVLRRSPPCQGCFLYDCTQRGRQCLTEIRVAEVLAACRSALEADNRQVPTPRCESKLRAPEN